MLGSQIDHLFFNHSASIIVPVLVEQSSAGTSGDGGSSGTGGGS